MVILLTVIGVLRVITIHFKFGKSDDGDYDTKLVGLGAPRL